MAGTQQAQFHEPASIKTADAVSAKARIESPTDGTILALDPDIPPQRQKLQLTANRSDVRWYMAGTLLGQGRQVQWQPWPGRHVLQLRDMKGQLLDEAALEVRGAAVKPAQRGS